jgi:NAD-dependent deacetylase
MRSMPKLWPEAPSMLILTGAGIRQESGLGTLRDADGIWANVRLEEVATREAFARDPARVQAFYNSQFTAAFAPALVRNPERSPRSTGQSRSDATRRGHDRDPKHRRSARAHRIEDVVHMHGELLKARCVAYGKVTVWYDDLTGSEDCPICAIEGQLRPHVV